MQLEAEVKGMDVYPNPIGDGLELKVDFYTDELEQSGWNSISIDITSLPTGAYLLTDNLGNVKRFVKVRE